MKTVVQRVQSAAVTVDGRDIASIGRGYLVLAGFHRDDGDEELAWMARKIVTLRVFEDDDGRMNKTLQAVGGSILMVSQFTLYGDCRKGARPSFVNSAPPEEASRLYNRFIALLKDEAPGDVATGEFQAHMQVSLVNDGPVTLVIEKEPS